MKAMFFIVTIGLASFAMAQQPETKGIAGASATTVGELLDGGGQKLTKDELMKLVKGTTIAGVLPSNPAWSSQKTYKDDGSLTGYNFRSSGSGAQTGVTGRWTINDRAELCVDLQQSYSVGQRFLSCTFFFKLGSAYYFATAEDRNTPVYVREIKR